LYEDWVAARLLLDMLGGTNSLGAGFGRIVHLDWQARDGGWHADDLAVSCAEGGTERATGLSIKSDRQVTSSGFPDHFVTAAWEHWLGAGGARPLRRKPVEDLVDGAGVLVEARRPVRLRLASGHEKNPPSGWWIILLAYLIW
jgi:hypothetical protein